eukprot:3902555-Rhodomonas_salina.1
MEERVREKEQEVAELRTLELHTRCEKLSSNRVDGELASMFDNFYNDFNRINSSMAGAMHDLASSCVLTPVTCPHVFVWISRSSLAPPPSLPSFPAPPAKKIMFAHLLTHSLNHSLTHSVGAKRMRRVVG